MGFLGKEEGVRLCTDSDSGAFTVNCGEKRQFLEKRK